MVSYAEHKAWLIRSREGFQAELDGFVAASYAGEPPPFYVGDAALRARFEMGYRDGRMMQMQHRVDADLLAGHREERESQP